MIKERGICPFGFPFYQWNPVCYGGSKSLPPVACRSFTGHSFRSLKYDQIRGRFIDVASGPIDAPETGFPDFPVDGALCRATND